MRYDDDDDDNVVNANWIAAAAATAHVINVFIDGSALMQC